MGAWGTTLYANDTTCDIRNMYMKYLGEEQLSNQEAYDKLIEECSECFEMPDDEEPLFWYALADTQWRIGKLMPEVKAKALEWIEKDGGLDLWEDSKVGGAGWKKTLEKLRAKLETEQPKEKKIRKPTAINQNLWNVGDVYAYQFNTEISAKNGALGKYMVMQKIGEEAYSSNDDLIMRVHVFDKLFDEVPALGGIKNLRILPFDFPNSTRDLCMNMWVGLYKKKEYPKDHLTHIGNMPIPANNVRQELYSSDADWFSIEGWSRYFPLWQGIEYETVEEGVFRYTHPTPGQ